MQPCFCMWWTTEEPTALRMKSVTHVFFVMLVRDWCNLSESQIIPVEDAIASTAGNLTFRNSPI